MKIRLASSEDKNQVLAQNQFTEKMFRFDYV